MINGSVTPYISTPRLRYPTTAPFAHAGAHKHRPMAHTDVMEIALSVTCPGTRLRFHHPLSFVETSTRGNNREINREGTVGGRTTIQPPSPLKTAATGPVGALGIILPWDLKYQIHPTLHRYISYLCASYLPASLSHLPNTVPLTACPEWWVTCHSFHRPPAHSLNGGQILCISVQRETFTPQLVPFTSNVRWRRRKSVLERKL